DGDAEGLEGEAGEAGAAAELEGGGHRAKRGPVAEAAADEEAGEAEGGRPEGGPVWGREEVVVVVQEVFDVEGGADAEAELAFAEDRVLDGDPVGDGKSCIDACHGTRVFRCSGVSVLGC